MKSFCIKKNYSFTVILLFIILLLVLSCNDEQIINDIPIEENCNPLVPEYCYFPYPSVFYLAEDSTTNTGYRINIPVDSSPGGIETDLINTIDGFSTISPMLALFAEEIDSSTLIDMNSIESSITLESSTFLLDITDGTLIPHFAELDMNATGNQRTLIIRPMKGMKTGHRIAAGITNSVKSVSGSNLTVSNAFRVLRDNIATDVSEINDMRERYSEIFQAFETAGISRRQLVLAWDFVIASDERLTAPLLHMRDSEISDTMDVSVEISNYEIDPSEDVWINFEGKLNVPNFCSSDGYFVYDDNNLPVKQGTEGYPFTLIVPVSLKGHTSAENPAKVLVFGHGIFSSPHNYLWYSGMMAEPLIDLANQMEVIIVGTIWNGLTASELSYAVSALSDLINIRKVTDRLMQGAINVMSLTKFVQQSDGLKSLAEFTAAENGTEDIYVSDDAPYYMGISLGGIMGTTFMAVNPDIKTGVLHVPGGGWSFMLRRSSDWTIVSSFFEGAVSEPLDQIITIALIQSYFDFSDPFTWIPHIIDDPVSDLGAKNCLWQESLYDEQVPNRITESMMRTIDIPYLSHSAKEVYGLDSVSADYSGSALIIWHDTDYEDNAIGNTPYEGGAHKAIRVMPEWRNETEYYLENGGVARDFCDGDCSF